MPSLTLPDPKLRHKGFLADDEDTFAGAVDVSPVHTTGKVMLGLVSVDRSMLGEIVTKGRALLSQDTANMTTEDAVAIVDGRNGSPDLRIEVFQTADVISGISFGGSTTHSVGLGASILEAAEELDAILPPAP